MKLKLCENNRWTHDAARMAEREFPRLKVQIVPCLRKCGPCAEMLVASLDGETLRARDGEELLEKLRRMGLK